MRFRFWNGHSGNNEESELKSSWGTGRMTLQEATGIICWEMMVSGTRAVVKELEQSGQIRVDSGPYTGAFCPGGRLAMSKDIFVITTQLG